MQRTLIATRIACAAILLAGANNQGVEFIIQRHVASKAAFKELADFFVRLRRRGELMALQQTPGIGLDHEYRVLACIQQDGVRCFWATAMDGEKLFAQRRRWSAEHLCQRPAVLRS